MFFTNIYRKIVPEKFRKSFYKHFLKEYFNAFDSLKYRSLYVFFSVFPAKTEKAKCQYFMGKYSIVNHPYTYYLEYMKKEVEYHFDTSKELPYVNHFGKKLYFMAMTKEKVIDAYRMLLLEQDVRSAHCYVEDYNVLKGKVILDVGTAEGIFALNAIDFAKHIYLFECEKEWIKPLNATFEAYKDKITIVEKYISNVTGANTTTLDDYFKDKSFENLFVKMDIEGFERKALQGSVELFNVSSNISGAICTYHKFDDEKVVSTFLSHKKCNYQKTNGYIYNERCLRTGVIRFSKQSS